MRLAIILPLLLLTAPAAATVQVGVEKWNAGDFVGAVAEWAEPVARGDTDALFNMGQAYRLGRGVTQNTSSAIDYYRRAADKGHVGAMTNLGITLFQSGQKTEALNQLRQAADKGDLRASYVLGVATFGGDGAQRNRALGYAYVARARDGGLAIASRQAARMATLMTEDERAKGEATAVALASGQPAPGTPTETLVARPASAGGGETIAQTNPQPTAPTGSPVAPRAEVLPGTKGWKVQLGAYKSQGAARTAWAMLVSQSTALLNGLNPIYTTGGNLVRLQVGPYAEKTDASSLCSDLSAAGRPCFVTR